ncbi:MAG TPA: hypothetical protein VG326_04895 [Tepidisphaeraceae bacterium]|nr:hypothetical protein [Tepidisphaeraceae bacterium]
MFFFRRGIASRSIQAAENRASIEGLEDRRLLSAAVEHAEVAGHSSTGVHAEVSHLHVGGTVVGVDTGADTVTISTGGAAGSATQTTYNLDPAATITASGKAVTLGQLVAGVKVVLTVSSTDATTATAIKATPTKVTGVVAAVDASAGTISLTTGRSSAAVSYTIPAAATITVNHAAGALADISVGSIVHLQFSPLSGTTVVSVASHSKTGAGLVSNGNPPATTNSGSTVNAGSASTGNGAATPAAGTSTGSDSSSGSGTSDISDTPTTSSGATTSAPVSSTTAHGMLVSVDTTADTITISTPSDKGAAATPTTYTLDPSATITADGAAAALGALADGDAIALTLNAATPAAVTGVVATGAKVGGSITAVDTTAGTITLTPRNGGASATYTIPSSATLTLDGATATLAGIVAGSSVKVQLSALSATTALSVTARTKPAGGAGSSGFGWGGIGQHISFGTLVSVDTAADTITLSNPFDSSGTSTTYTLASTATVSADSAAATLGALAVGDQILLTLGASTPATVTAVKAIGKTLDGSVTAVDTTAGTITVTPGDAGASTTVTIPSTATINIDGAAGTLAGVTTGSLVHIQYSALDNTAITSVNDFALPAVPGGNHHNANTVVGTLVSVDSAAGAITLSGAGHGSASGTQTTYTLASTATITADGATATLSALAVGDSVVLSLNSTTPATVATVKATGKTLNGKVTAVDTTADTITLTPDDGSASTTITITSGATITVGGASGTLAGVAVGSQVHVQYSALDNTTVSKVNDFTIPTATGGGPGAGHQNSVAFGALVSVDATANTITLSSGGYDSSTPTQTTYTLGAAATITADGAAATLGSLAVGDQIILKLSSTTPITVTSIKATGKGLGGEVTAVDTTADTITLTPDGGGASTTVTIPSGAAITVNGATGALSGVTVGAQVHIQYSALDNTQIVSVTAFTPPTGWGGVFGSGGGNGKSGASNGAPSAGGVLGAVASLLGGGRGFGG